MIRTHISTPTVEAALAAHRMRLWLAEGNTAAAARCALERRLQASDEPNYAREVGYITLTRVLVVQGKLDEAKDLLAQLRQTAETSSRMGRVVEILVLQAQGNLPQAMAVLEQALSLAEPEGYVRIFLDESAIFILGLSTTLPLPVGSVTWNLSNRSMNRGCNLAGCIVVNHSEHGRIKATLEETCESECMHRIRITGCSSAQSQVGRPTNHL